MKIFVETYFGCNQFESFRLKLSIKDLRDIFELIDAVRKIFFNKKQNFECDVSNIFYQWWISGKFRDGCIFQSILWTELMLVGFFKYIYEIIVGVEEVFQFFFFCVEMQNKVNGTHKLQESPMAKKDFINF